MAGLEERDSATNQSVVEAEAREGKDGHETTLQVIERTGKEVLALNQRVRSDVLGDRGDIRDAVPHDKDLLGAFAIFAERAGHLSHATKENKRVMSHIGEVAFDVPEKPQGESVLGQLARLEATVRKLHEAVTLEFLGSKPDHAAAHPDDAKFIAKLANLAEAASRVSTLVNGSDTYKERMQGLSQP